MQSADASNLRALRLALVVAAAVLCLAFLDWPYGYYQLLRIVVTAVAIWMAVVAHGQGRSGWMLIGAAVAILHNPVIKIAFSREVWAYLDWAVAAVLIGAAMRLHKPADDQ